MNDKQLMAIWARKGANGKFYKDDMWDSDPVLDMETLLDHWNKYFSKSIRSNAYDTPVEYKMT